MRKQTWVCLLVLAIPYTLWSQATELETLWNRLDECARAARFAPGLEDQLIRPSLIRCAREIMVQRGHLMAENPSERYYAAMIDHVYLYTLGEETQAAQRFRYAQQFRQGIPGIDTVDQWTYKPPLDAERPAPAHSAAYHLVQPGETVEILAYQYGVPTPQLRRMNGLEPGEQPAPGRQLLTYSSEPATEAIAAAASPSASPAIASALTRRGLSIGPSRDAFHTPPPTVLYAQHYFDHGSVLIPRARLRQKVLTQLTESERLNLISFSPFNPRFFPESPPPPSSTEVLSKDEFLGEARTLKDAHLILSRALKRAGYPVLFQYSRPGGAGFTLLTTTEQTDLEGNPLPEPQRWDAEVRYNIYRFSNYLSSLYFNRPGYYRILVLQVTPKAGVSIPDPPSSSSSFPAPAAGRDSLQIVDEMGYPQREELKLLDYPLSDYEFTVSVYEYGQPNSMYQAQLRKESGLSPRLHLIRAGLIRHLIGTQYQFEWEQGYTVTR